VRDNVIVGIVCVKHVMSVLGTIHARDIDLIVGYTQQVCSVMNYIRVIEK